MTTVRSPASSKALTYFAVGNGPAGARSILCRISDEAGERHQLFGQRLDWSHVSQGDVNDDYREITAKRAGQIIERIRKEAANEQ